MVARATVATRTTLPLTPSSTISTNSAQGARAIHEPPNAMQKVSLLKKLLSIPLWTSSLLKTRLERTGFFKNPSKIPSLFVEFDSKPTPQKQYNAGHWNSGTSPPPAAPRNHKCKPLCSTHGAISQQPTNGLVSLHAKHAQSTGAINENA